MRLCCVSYFLLEPNKDLYVCRRVDSRHLNPAEHEFGGIDHAAGRSKKGSFLNLCPGMLQRRPEDRKTAREPYRDPWLRSCLNVPQFR